jgi:hypothetical protein
MKTLNPRIYVKKLAVSFCFALVIATGSFTQPVPDSDINEVSASLVRLEEFMKSAAKNIRYIAPTVQDSDELSSELERLVNKNQESEPSASPNVHVEKPVYLIDNSWNSDTYVKSYTREKNCKVLQVSYYQTSKVSALNKLRKLFSKKSSEIKKMNTKTIAAAYITNVEMK